MVSFARLFLRFFVILLGFSLASLAAGFTYAILTRLVRPEDFGAVSDIELTVTLMIGVVGISSLIARAALFPALMLIGVFEILRLRDWLSHALAGAGLALVLSLSATGRGDAFAAALTAAHVACGIVAATVYWLVSGHRAGRWLPSEIKPRPEGHPPL